MATLSAASNWVCGTCVYPNKGGKFCTMCAATCPKRHAVLAVLAADMPVAAAAAPAKVHPPQGAVAPANVPPPVPAPAPMVVDVSSALLRRQWLMDHYIRLALWWKLLRRIGVTRATVVRSTSQTAAR